MNDNREDIDRLVNQFIVQKRQDRKHLLQIEIAKATDRTVKQALQKMLDDIEQKERRDRAIGIILMIILLIVFAFFALFFLGTKSSSQTSLDPIHKSLSSASKDVSVTENNYQQVGEKEKHLSENEVKQWVNAVWGKEYANNLDMLEHQLTVELNDNDNLVYIELQGTENDFYKKFRINANGELEQADSGSWSVVSNKFMDTSNVSVLENNNQKQEIDTRALNSEEAINWVKNYRFQKEGINDEGDNKFKTQISEDQLLEIVVYAWNLAKTFQTISSVYRINQSGYLEKGAPSTFSNWEVVSTKYIN